jgi:uncharacterized protein YecE (DUF72 family)
MRPLAESGKLGPLLWQLPATLPRDDERLAAALDAMPEVGARRRVCLLQQRLGGIAVRNADRLTRTLR